MPLYELEIIDPDGGWQTHSQHESPDGEFYDVGHRFEHEGQTLRVRLVQDSENDQCVQKLVCAPD
jgi:hypothetical protein